MSVSRAALMGAPEGSLYIKWEGGCIFVVTARGKAVGCAVATGLFTWRWLEKGGLKCGIYTTALEALVRNLPAVTATDILATLTSAARDQDGEALWVSK